MKRFLKSYLVFTSLIYRIVMFIIIPIVIIVTVLWSGGGFESADNLVIKSEPRIAVCAVVMLFLPMIEIISDNWMFGGIQSKNADKLDYLKTSSIGMQVLRSALLIDLLRKFLLALGIICISYGILYWKLMTDLISTLIENDWKLLLLTLLGSYFFSVLGTVLARYGSMIWINVMVAYLLEIIILVFIFSALKMCADVYCLLFAILDVAVSVLAVRIVMKKVEGSYYDK